jgi:hypothetical protein
MSTIWRNTSNWQELDSAGFEVFCHQRIWFLQVLKPSSMGESDTLQWILMFLTLHMLHNNQPLVVYNLSMDIYTREQLRIQCILPPIESQTPLWWSTFCLLLSHIPFWLNRRQNVPPECVLSCFLVCESWDMKMPKTKANDMWVRSLSLETTHSFIHWFMHLHISSNFVKMKTAEESKSIMEGGPLNSSPKPYVHWGWKKNKKTDINSF